MDKGIDDLLEAGKDRVLAVLSLLILPIKNALSTKDKIIVVSTLRKLKKLVLCGESIGAGLVPYYRQILPIFNLLKH